MSMDRLILELAQRLYRQRAGMFYAGLPHPAWDEIDNEIRQNHIDYVEKKFVEFLNAGFDNSTIGMVRLEANEDGRRSFRLPNYVALVSAKTRSFELKMARVGVTRAWCGSRYGGEMKQSFARSVAALIRDVHSPMDCDPVHQHWDVVY